MAYSWIKLWIEILDDPKMGQLSDRLFRRTIEFFLLAGRAGLDGELPDVRSSAWTCRVTEESILADMQILKSAGILTENEPGRWSVTNFSKRQSAASNAQRVAEYRKRKNVTNRYSVCNDVVTFDSESESESESESISESPLISSESPLVLSESDDNFIIMRNLVEEMTGYLIPNNEAEINAINELVKINAGRDDFIAALSFLKGKKVVRGACDLLPSIRYNIAKRIQGGNGTYAKASQKINIHTGDL